MPQESSDVELIEATLPDDEPAFETLMKRYERFVYKLAYGFGRSHDNALDLSQTVFLAAGDVVELVPEEPIAAKSGQRVQSGSEWQYRRNKATKSLVRFSR